MQLQIFKYEEDESHFDNLTTIEIEGEVWFVASEVCKLLDIENTTNAIKSLDDDEKLPFTLERAGQNRQVNLISEISKWFVLKLDCKRLVLRTA